MDRCSRRVAAADPVRSGRHPARLPGHLEAVEFAVARGDRLGTAIAAMGTDSESS
jgi:hypothetical protein